jgi:hypothetical protein
MFFILSSASGNSGEPSTGFIAKGCVGTAFAVVFFFAVSVFAELLLPELLQAVMVNSATEDVANAICFKFIKKILECESIDLLTDVCFLKFC